MTRLFVVEYDICLPEDPPKNVMNNLLKYIGGAFTIFLEGLYPKKLTNQQI